MLKFDMHCHTKYGSIDANVKISEYVEMLSEKGYDGMLVTDHDSYRGYNRWKKENPESDFTVLRGIEYDTRDAGHFLVIMPDGIHLKALTMRGMKVAKLVDLVHSFGGIVGPAHPFGTKSSSAMLFKALRENRSLVNEFDFIEGFNACETETANDLSELLANDFNKPKFGGSDSHDHEYVGLGYTYFSDNIKTCDDLIASVKNYSKIECGGRVRGETIKSKHAHAFYSVYAFLAYNFSLGLIYTPVRGYSVRKALQNNI